MSMLRRSVSVVLVFVALMSVGLFAGSAADARRSRCTSPRDPGGDWPFYGKDLANTRNQDQEDSIDVLAAATLTPAWVFSAAETGAQGTFESTPVVSNGCVFVASNDGMVFALDATSGQVQWMTKLKDAPRGASLAVAEGKVFANLSPRSRPTVVAIDQHTGDVIWQTIVDRQEGALTDTSPMVWDGLVFIGVASTDGEPEEVRSKFQGNYSILDADDGRILVKGWMIPDGSKRYAGAGIWATAAIDRRSGYAYVGGGNPYGRAQHRHSDGLVKIDVDPRRETFGDIVASYRGTSDRYVGAVDEIACPEIGEDPIFLTECHLDLDFGSSPNLFRNEKGRLLIGALQKSGVYHALDAKDMKRSWSAIVGPPTPFGNASSSAYDGERIVLIGSPPGQITGIAPGSGTIQWVAPTGSAAHYNPVSNANGVAYTVDLRGVLSAYDTSTGVPLLQRPVHADVGGVATSQSSGVSIARHTVFVALGDFIVAYRPGP